MSGSKLPHFEVREHVLMIFMFFFLPGEECNSAEDEGIERDSSEMEEPSSAMHPNALTSLTQVLDVSIALERI